MRDPLAKLRLEVHQDAPSKPSLGAPCNGCGVCCLAEPCPVGIVVSGRRRGPCRALVWSDAERRYRCGVVTEPARFVPRPLAPAVAALARRWISAGSGCDADVEVET